MLKKSVSITSTLPNTQVEQLEIPSSINAVDYKPARIYEIELGEVLPVLSAINGQTGQHYQRAWCLIRLHSQPLGIIEMNFSQDVLAPDQYIQHIWADLYVPINEHLEQDGLPPISHISSDGLPSPSTPACVVTREHFMVSAPFASIIVPTHDRPDRLAVCLHSLLALHYPKYEIIVVDNTPTTSATFEIVQEAQKNAPHVFYVREDRPGASLARNSGIEVAKGEILAFTDDDVIVDPHWLTELIYAFGSSDNVVCVTGSIMPMELETLAQCLFERYGAFPRTFKQKKFNMGKNHPKTPLFPFSAGSFGAGASMAFTASGIRDLGGFDPALGGIGPSKNGQDIDLFFRVIIQGHTLVYNPSAILFHQHRRDLMSLRQQIYSYGVGFTAYLTKNLCKQPSLLFPLTANIPRGLLRLLKARSNKNHDPLTKSTYYPAELTRLELKGMLYGPLAYLQTRWLMRKIPKVPVPQKNIL